MRLTATLLGSLLALGCSSAPASSDSGSAGPDSGMPNRCSPASGTNLPAGTPCDPRASNCAAGGCYNQAPLGGCPFLCVATSGPGVAAGGPCLYLNDCAPGLVCVEAVAVAGCTSELCCTQFCDVATSGCPAPSTCQRFNQPEPIPPGLVGVGACAAP